MVSSWDIREILIVCLILYVQINVGKFREISLRKLDLTEDKPDFAYHVIETLLPTANYNEEEKRGKMIEM